MVFAIGLVVGTQAHAGFVTHKSTLILELGATTKGVNDYYIYHGNTLDSACLQMLPNVSNFEGAALPVKLNVLRYLGALPGEGVYLRVKAYGRVSDSALFPPKCSFI
jgi:hypothetical protein